MYDDIACSNGIRDDMTVDEEHSVFHVIFYHLFSSIAHLYSVEIFFTDARELYSSIFFFAVRPSRVYSQQGSSLLWHWRRVDLGYE
jgi:hypothetical protein